MIDDQFEWDDAKAASNLSKHGVSFEQAREAFGDPFGLEFADDRHGDDEDRYVLLGMVGERLLVVVSSHERGQSAHHLGARGRAA